MVIDRFTGEHAFLSNFYPSPILLSDVLSTPFEAPTVEHAFQALKTADLAARASILAASTPGRAKRMGRLVTLRPSWGSMRLYIMRWLVREKFAQNPDLAEKLRATGNAILIEGNAWGDTFWGQVDGKGENHLGVILMDTRDHLLNPTRGKETNEPAARRHLRIYRM